MFVFMGVVFRQSVKTSIVVFSGAVLGGLTIWLFTKYIPNKQQFGFTRTLTSQSVILSQILLFGLSSTLFVFTHRFAENVKKRNALFSVCMVIPLFITGLFTLFWFLFRNQILNHYQPADKILMEHYYSWLPLNTILYLYMTIIEQYLGSQMKVAVSAFMREVVLRILNIAIIILYAFHFVGFGTLIMGSVLIYLLPIVAFLIIAFQNKELHWVFDINVFKRQEYMEIFQFAWYHFLLGVSYNLIGMMDILALPFYNHAGFSSVAVYSVAVYIISFLQIPSKAFLPASFSTITRAFTENNLTEAKDLFNRASLNLLIPTVCVAVLLLCNMNNAVAIIGAGKNYAEIIPIFQILLIGRMVDIGTGMNDQVLSITNYYRFNFYVSLILIIVLFALIRFLTPAYGNIGAAWSTTIAIILYNTAKYVFVWKKIGMQPFSLKTLKTLLAGTVTYLAVYFLHEFQNPFVDAVIRSTMILVIYLFILLLLRPSDDLTNYIKSIKTNKRLY